MADTPHPHDAIFGPQGDWFADLFNETYQNAVAVTPEPDSAPAHTPEVLLAISANINGEVVPRVTLFEDFTFQFEPGYDPDEAARIFWHHLVLEGRTLHDKADEMERAADYWKDQWQRVADAFTVVSAQRDVLEQKLRALTADPAHPPLVTIRS